MTETSPPNGINPWLLAFICATFGLLAGYAGHELAGFRPFVPPILSGSNNMACADLDAYVQHVSDVSDHRRHDALVGIHRRATIDAVNELYDRARCNPVRDALGHETYHQFRAEAVDDVNDPGPHAVLEPPRPYPLYSHGTLVSPATASTPSRTVAITTRRHGYHIQLRDDDVQSLEANAAEENQAGSPAGAALPGYGAYKPFGCAPAANGINYGCVPR